MPPEGDHPKDAKFDLPPDHPEFRKMQGDGPEGGSLLYPIIVVLGLACIAVYFILF